MFESKNPVNGEIIARFEKNEHPEKTIKSAELAFLDWSNTSLAERIKLIENLADVLENKKVEFAKDVSLEMGKRYKDAIAEIEKCAKTAKYYGTAVEDMLEPKKVNNYAHKAYYRSEPTGGIFAIMPWNFPFWQVMRFAIPTILSGNVVLLKHAPNVFISADNIKNAFELAGFPKGVFSLLNIDIDQVEDVISHNFIKGVTLTGSNIAGSSVGALAGKHLKKSVLELGGSDPFIVLKDADIKEAAFWAVKSRFQNAGQTCIAAKRWIVEEEVYDVFMLEILTLISNISTGDPFDDSMTYGPMARLELAEKVECQLADLEHLGATPIVKGKRNGCFFSPSLYQLSKEISVQFVEELFGPVACIIKAENELEAIEIANETCFGLGASIWTQEIEKGEILMQQLKAGSVFLNSMVKSDVSMPFGGIGNSGYGRELGVYGLQEFCNVKSYIIEK
ncbi:aldehyde dehydrogenase family protein [Lacihabitans sp. LS3-19]|uniref:aldehyde dehydrogenase family protein n=1 Tax=Lacihabitans sp. LS3-19 TaxID=2487335 RepID=UPI0020CD046C|nr:aldehyde dehydrogenase family protein [Lacihabitans sp. LS3-19]MCP9769784.1 aldehyde dehydrogenase family protein [Lacihabitans sp. LS3-19]